MARHALGLGAVMLGIAATVLFATMLLAGPAQPVPQSAEAASQLAAGDAALARLDLAAAVAAYRAAVGAAPWSYEAAWKLARALADSATLSQRREEQKKLCLEAEGFARKAVLLDPAGAQGHDYLAIALGKLALFEGGKRKVELSKEVKAEADEALGIRPDDDLAFHVLAIWNRELVQLNWFLRQAAQVLYGRLPQASLDAALADLERACRLRPDVIPHHVELGITQEAAGRLAEAKTELENALALPTGWVTDDYYRALARQHLDRVKARLE